MIASHFVMTISTPPLSEEPEPAPRAPTQAEWDAMTPAARQRAAAALPTYIPNEELGTMDGQTHQRARDGEDVHLTRRGVADAARGWSHPPRR